MKFPAVIFAAAVISAAPAFAQQASAPLASAPIKRIPLQKSDVPGTSYEAITGIAEIAPNVSIGRHSHFGTETGYVLEGETTLLIDGQPPKVVKAGDSYVIPAGAVHDAKSGATPVRVLATYIVEKGKPLATPAQ
jgi:quercetin dioxygenase-like cupin family protein